MANTEWVAPGRGATVTELLVKLGRYGGGENGGLQTELAIVRPDDALAPYDRVRAVEALRRVGVHVEDGR